MRVVQKSWEELRIGRKRWKELSWSGKRFKNLRAAEKHCEKNWGELRWSEKSCEELRSGGWSWEGVRQDVRLHSSYYTQNLSFNPIKQHSFLLEASAPRPVRVLFAVINLYLILVVGSNSCGRFFWNQASHKKHVRTWWKLGPIGDMKKTRRCV